MKLIKMGIISYNTLCESVIDVMNGRVGRPSTTLGAGIKTTPKRKSQTRKSKSDFKTQNKERTNLIILKFIF